MSRNERAAEAADQQHQPRRIQEFARFFKNYMSISSLVTAALPIPATTLGFIPTYSAHAKYLAAYTSLICFLLLGFLFYSRHALAQYMFPRHLGSPDASVSIRPSGRTIGLVAFAPLLLIVGAVLSIFLYQTALSVSVATKIKNDVRAVEPTLLVALSNQVPNESKDLIERLVRVAKQYERDLQAGIGTHGSHEKYVLAVTDYNQIPYGILLVGLYLFIFIFALSALILMAIKEYLQDVIGVSDLALIQERVEEAQFRFSSWTALAVAMVLFPTMAWLLSVPVTVEKSKIGTLYPIAATIVALVALVCLSVYRDALAKYRTAQKIVLWSAVLSIVFFFAFVTVRIRYLDVMSETESVDRETKTATKISKARGLVLVQRVREIRPGTDEKERATEEYGDPFDLVNLFFYSMTVSAFTLVFGALGVHKRELVSTSLV